MARYIFSLLGQFQIEQRNVGAIPFTNRKAIALLAYLLVEADHAHSREFLLGLLWPDLSTAAAQNNLRVTWSSLQKALKPGTPNTEPYLISDRLALRFNPQSDHELDLTRFHTLVEACRRHVHPDPQKCAECAARLTEALTLVRGGFLDEFALDNCAQFEEWLRTQRAYFQMQVTSALETLATFQERAGQLADAERTVRRLLEYDPLNEAAYRQLMRVLARLDQRGAALDLYETCRRILATELGLPLAVETVTLAEQIRAMATAEPPAPQIVLPPVFTRFFGRRQESAHLVDLLTNETVHVVTLTGPGGVGKTRLAVDVAQRLASDFVHAICFVDLTGVSDGNAVGDAVAAALHLPTSTGRSSTSAIVDYLRERHMLLVLDNCEHLLEAAAGLVQTLCRAATGLTVLATSRIPLHLPKERVVRLEPLAAPASSAVPQLTVADALRFDAVQLFTDRIAQSLLHFTLTDTNVLAVMRICQQLDGMPLAIEIAAAQARALPIDVIAERLSQRFAWLNRQMGETIPRQRTLHALIDWSYGLLDQQERALLCRLAVFAGGWTLEAAEAVSAPGEPCAELLIKLVDHSLVAFGVDTERRRYGMHETIRQFAQEQLRGSGHEEVVLARHAHYYGAVVACAAEHQSTEALVTQLRTLTDDHDNLRLAFDWLLAHEREQALVLVAQLGTALNFWELGGFFQEGRRWLRRALEGTQTSVSRQRAQALLAAADLSSAITDFDYGVQCAQDAREIFVQLGDQRGEIDAGLKYCTLADLMGQQANIQAEIAALFEMAERIAYPAGIAKAQLILGAITADLGQNDVAIQHLLPSIASWRNLQRPFDLANALNQLAGVLSECNEYAAATQAFEECRDIYQMLGYQRGVATATQNIGGILFDLGDYTRARALFCEALRIRQALGLPRGYAYSFEFIADVNEAENRYTDAVQLLAAADTLRTRHSAPVELVNQKTNEEALTRLRAQLGDVAFALAWSKGVALSTEQAIALALR